VVDEALDEQGGYDDEPGVEHGDQQEPADQTAVGAGEPQNATEGVALDPVLHDAAVAVDAAVCGRTEA
jgi:hypothetical protein